MKIEEALPKILKVIRLYEGGKVTCDFDGAGISIGTLQWNVKTNTLQPMIRKMFDRHWLIMESIFGSNFNVLKQIMQPRPTSEQMDWARSINTYVAGKATGIKEPWESKFLEMIKTPQWLEIEMEVIKGKYLEIAITDTKWSGVRTLRSLCMFFDMATQNGGMGTTLKLALSAAKPIIAMLNDVKDKQQEVKDKAWLITCAGTRALVAYLRMPQFALNVFKRKLGIIEGGYNWRKGELPHFKEDVDFDAIEYGITDELIEDL